MLWFKHFNDLSRDEGIRAYLDDSDDRFAAYGFFILIMELVCERMIFQYGDPKCSVTLSRREWARVTDCHTNRVNKYLPKLGVIGWVSVEFDGDYCTVEIPKLLEWRDESSRKSGRIPEGVAQRRGEEKRKEETRGDTQERPHAPGVRDSGSPGGTLPTREVLARSNLGGEASKNRLDPRSFDDLKILIRPLMEKFGSDPQVIYNCAGQSLRMSLKQIATCVNQLVQDGEVTPNSRSTIGRSNGTGQSRSDQV
jgi:hypothetical protein